MGVVNEMRGSHGKHGKQVRVHGRRSRFGYISTLALLVLVVFLSAHHCSALKRLDLEDLEELEKSDDKQGGAAKVSHTSTRVVMGLHDESGNLQMELKRGQEKEDTRSMKLPREEVKLGQTHEHLYGDRESSYSGDGMPTSSGHLDVSVAKIEAIFAAIRPVKFFLLIRLHMT